ncbi:MAG: tRNA (adenosine(37)-N6)-threonylcarbamoyltransferase complex dimerization subunit type 1 TsaB [Actinomycetota bacterium]
MTSLVIDTSTSRTSVGLFDGAIPLFAGRHDGATEHGEALPRLVEGALEVASSAGREITEVIVGMGPGPFTGLRAGITFAKVFAHARKIPVAGVCSLDGIVSGVDGEYIVATDARRKEIYWAKYESGKRIGSPQVSLPEVVKAMGLPVYGEGAEKYGFEADIDLIYPHPLFLLAVSEWADNFHEPMYLRKPDAVPTSERR